MTPTSPPRADARAANDSRSPVALLSGNELIACGALAAGCNFFSGYPITPASEIYAEMMRRLPARGGVAIGAPDEISALSYAVGASLAGARAMTATSGPGWSLMIETMQFALMTETPVVIVVSQRLGPATGGATQNAQGDILLIEHATSGGYPIPVLCPVDGIDAYAVTAEAFSWAEELRTPVVVMTDKETSKTIESVPLDRLTAVDVPARPGPVPGERFVPYHVHSVGDVPHFAPVGGQDKVTVTGSAHNQDGRLRKNDLETLRQLRHLAAKIDERAESLEWVRWEPQQGARCLIVSYGVTARACRQAVRDLADEGVAVDLLEVLSLFPIPRRALARATEGIARVIVVEENRPGLYARELRAHLGSAEVRQVNAVGALIEPGEICSEVTS